MATSGYPRESDEGGDNNCVAIRGRGQVGGLRTWEDAQCSDNNHFICEYLWWVDFILHKLVDTILIVVDHFWCPMGPPIWIIEIGPKYDSGPPPKKNFSKNSRDQTRTKI